MKVKDLLGIMDTECWLEIRHNGHTVDIINTKEDSQDLDHWKDNDIVTVGGAEGLNGHRYLVLNI